MLNFILLLAALPPPPVANDIPAAEFVLNFWFMVSLICLVMNDKSFSFKLPVKLKLCLASIFAKIGRKWFSRISCPTELSWISRVKICKIVLMVRRCESLSARDGYVSWNFDWNTCVIKWMIWLFDKWLWHFLFPDILNKIPITCSCREKWERFIILFDGCECEYLRKGKWKRQDHAFRLYPLISLMFRWPLWSKSMLFPLDLSYSAKQHTTTTFGSSLFSSRLLWKIWILSVTARLSNRRCLWLHIFALRAKLLIYLEIRTVRFSEYVSWFVQFSSLYGWFAPGTNVRSILVNSHSPTGNSDNFLITLSQGKSLSV